VCRSTPTQTHREQTSAGRYTRSLVKIMYSLIERHEKDTRARSIWPINAWKSIPAAGRCAIPEEFLHFRFGNMDAGVGLGKFFT
jgi:hypothetical protein